MSRLKALYERYKRIRDYFLGCFNWESIPRSIISLVLLTWLTLQGEPYMVPLIGALLFFAEMIAAIFIPLDEERESRQSLKAKLVRLQELAATMQNTMGTVASYGERLLKSVTANT
ncbi:hypothetical protein HPB52_014222 [Rhipicephalus sanguineus]|uniref:Uncharacterized protein n=1 Tax=Rhipicephalus sanguineus TaxID=34632 RepID=A0A9D4Q0D0_RHISA|nr:hypothetical protein HPB52_014222 [Rhipicephalus sanguineus]